MDTFPSYLKRLIDELKEMEPIEIVGIIGAYQDKIVVGFDEIVPVSQLADQLVDLYYEG